MERLSDEKIPYKYEHTSNLYPKRIDETFNVTNQHIMSLTRLASHSKRRINKKLYNINYGRFRTKFFLA